jgi:hypothetical protein
MATRHTQTQECFKIKVRLYVLTFTSSCGSDGYCLLWQKDAAAAQRGGHTEPHELLAHRLAMLASGGSQQAELAPDMTSQDMTAASQVRHWFIFPLSELSIFGWTASV